MVKLADNLDCADVTVASSNLDDNNQWPRDCIWPSFNLIALVSPNCQTAREGGEVRIGAGGRVLAVKREGAVEALTRPAFGRCRFPVN